MLYNLIKILSLLFMGFAFVAAAQSAEQQVSSKKAKGTTTGFMQEITEIRVHNGPDRSGKEVYEFRCKGCHERNTQGAPMPDDKFDWSMRLREKGMDTLLKHSMEGFNNYLMPPKGGCRDCNQAEVYAGAFYMMERSGIDIKKYRKK